MAGEELLNNQGKDVAADMAPLPSSQMSLDKGSSETLDQQRTSELLKLLELWQQTQSTEEEIVLAERALWIEQKIVDWAPDFSREQMRGALLFNIGTNYQKRHQETRADDLEKAVAALETALTIRVRDAYPEEWARTKHHLALAYSDRLAGEHAENVEKSISFYQEALTILTHEEFPRDSAVIQSNLSLAYADRIHGQHSENIEQAIECCKSALTVLSREAFPHEWGQAQINMGLAYSSRIHGDRSENLERAIEAYEAAATALTRESYQHEWGRIQNNLAIAYTNRIRGEHADNLERAISIFEESLTVLTYDAFPLDWALAQNNLSTTYLDRIRGERAGNLESAITHLEAAITIYTREMFPHDWAMCQLNLGLVYQRRIQGQRLDNIEKAIAYSEAALGIYTQAAFPRRWADTQHNLAVAYTDRILGDRADNIERAIAHVEAALIVYTREEFPHDWAKAQTILGVAHFDRIYDEPGDNLEKSISAYQSALTVLTREGYPLEWATTQCNLANTYNSRIRGERGENLERAIAASDAALTMLTREGQPLKWGRAQNGLAASYARRLRGVAADNIERAIAHFDAALTYFTFQTDPEQYALLQDNLGIAYTDRIHGERAENIEKAINHFEAALTHFTPDINSAQWAKIQNNIGITYWNRIAGDRGTNLERAIYHFHTALTVRTHEALPEEWAQTQHNLGLVYCDRILGMRAQNLGEAIAAFDAALKEYTPESFPRDHLITSRLLGAALIEIGNWQKARIALLSARDAFLLLFGQGLVETEARELIKIAGPLFSEAAFVTAELGDAASALALLSEGKARLFAIALKLQTLELPPDERARLVALRRAIYEAESLLDSAQGIYRGVALERLVTLRSELRALVEMEENRFPARVVATAIVDTLTYDGSVIAAPIITNVGAKMLLITQENGVPRLTVLDVPELTTNRLRQFVEGPTDATKLGGWIGAYNIQYLPQGKQEERIGEWLSAIEDVGPTLWQLVVGPVHKELSERGVKLGGRLFWLPTDALGLLPLCLAQDPITGSVLGDSFDIAYAPSLEILQSAYIQHAAPQRPTLAAVINPTEDLDFTEIEGRLVACHFSPSDRIVIEREAATPSAVLAALKGANYWHFAGHGAFSWDDARQSAIILSNNVPLTVGELLEAENLGRPRLVVLSACETGLYDIGHAPDEFVGLPGAFMALGAAGVLSTLWPVDDRATALLIARFYEALFGEGLTPPAALKHAQEWLRTATREELIVYVKTVKNEGKIVDPKMAQQLEDSLSRWGHQDARFALIWASLEKRDKEHALEVARKERHTSRKAKSGERLFAHPYFWGGFFYTGL